MRVQIAGGLAPASPWFWAPRVRRFAIAAFAASVFFAIAEDVVLEEHDEIVLRVDRALQAMVAALPAPVHSLAVLISHLTGEGATVMGALGMVVLITVGRRADAIEVVTGTLMAWGLAGVLQAVCGAFRSGAENGTVWLVMGRFPSEHSLTAVVVLGTIAGVLGRDRTRLARSSLWVSAASMALAMGVAQIMTSHYWPSHVVGGLAAGAAWLAVVAPGARPWYWTEREQPLRTPGEPSTSRPRSDWRSPRVRYQVTEVAEAYDQRFHGLRGRYHNWRLFRLLNKCLWSLPPDSVVLDVPCGTGRVDNWLQEKSLRVVAADISSAMLTVAHRKVRRTSAWLGFVRADVEHLPFRSRSVDAVVSIRFLHLLDRDARLTVLREMARVAKHEVIIEYRGLDRRVKLVKRALVRRLTGRNERRSRIISGMTDELSECDLRVERCYFFNRLFSGGVLILTIGGRPTPVEPPPPTG